MSMRDQTDLAKQYLAELNVELDDDAQGLVVSNAIASAKKGLPLKQAVQSAAGDYQENARLARSLHGAKGRLRHG